jgi:hypothetical protein
MPIEALHTLNRMLARLASSLLQYLGGAWPWVPASEQAALDGLMKLQAEEAAAIRKLWDFLIRRRAIPVGSRFPEEFTTLHFVGLDHLLPRLVAYQRWLVDGNEIDVSKLSDAEARSVALPILDMNRRHLSALEKLSTDRTGARAASTVR